MTKMNRSYARLRRLWWERQYWIPSVCWRSYGSFTHLTSAWPALFAFAGHPQRSGCL